MSAIESHPPSSWKLTSSVGMPWTLPSTSASSVKMCDRPLLHARRQSWTRSSRARISRNGVWWCSSSGSAQPAVVRPIGRLLDQEAQARQHMVAMLDDAAGDVLPASPPARIACEHAILQIRESIQHGGDEHVAGHAADGVEMDDALHALERLLSPARPQELRPSPQAARTP